MSENHTQHINNDIIDEVSDFDDSDADHDYEPVEKKRKTFFNLQKLCVSDEPEFINLSSQLGLDKNTQMLKCSVSEDVQVNSNNDNNIKEVTVTMESEYIQQICKEILDGIIDKICFKGKPQRNRIEKYTLLLPCNDQCRKKCSKKIGDLERNNIRTTFWTMTFGERRLFLDSHIKQHGVKTRVQEALSSNRNYSIRYFLPIKNHIESGNNLTEDLQVCKTMFLHTLGLKTDGMITAHLREKRNSGNGVAKTKDDRGLVARAILNSQKVDNQTAIINHINSFNPVVSHYNLKHSPNRRYLPPELTVSFMWKDFCIGQKVGYDLYRNIFKQQNIGFSRPSQDECDTCKIYKSHSSELNSSCTCKTCIYYNDHKLFYTEARQAYQADKAKELTSAEKIFSVDMQKVLLLPKMSTKNSFFVSRYVIIIFINMLLL